MSHLIDLVGKRFGRWIVLARVENAHDGQPQWLCRCDCGNEKVVRGGILRRGDSRSCGCLHSDETKKRVTTHGLSQSREYRSWSMMIRRCTNEADKSWPYYGGRGIKVCKRWMKFENFLADMGKRPDGLSLERNAVNGDYKPSNCCWATKKNQSRNRRDTIYLTREGETQTLAAWAEQLGIRAATIHQRLFRGMPVEEVLRPASTSVRSSNRMLTLNGETHSIVEWSKITGMDRKLLTLRAFKGWSDEKILTQPVEIHVRRKKP